MIDIDGFKVVNDYYGYDVGDKVLIMIVNMLRDYFCSDDLVCCLGGDEFLVICFEINIVGGVYIVE